MVMKTQGKISIGDIRAELVGTSSRQLSASDFRALAAPLSGLRLSHYYGKSSETVLSFGTAGTTYIQTGPGVTSARLVMISGGGGGASGGRGGGLAGNDGEVPGAGGGGGGGGGGRQHIDVTVNFPAGSLLIIRTGGGGAGGAEQTNYSANGHWVTGAKGNAGAPGGDTSVEAYGYGVLATVSGGGGGIGGDGGAPSWAWAVSNGGAGGAPGGGNGGGYWGANNSQGGVAGIGAGDGGGYGGVGGNAQINTYSSDTTGLAGNPGATGAVTVYVKGTAALDSGASVIFAHVNDKTVTGNFTNVPCIVSGGTAPYSYTWNLVNDWGIDLTNINSSSARISPTDGAYGTGNISCTVRDAVGRTITSNIAYVSIEISGGGGGGGGLPP
jgi:hypothetical protein